MYNFDVKFVKEDITMELSTNPYIGSTKAMKTSTFNLTRRSGNTLGLLFRHVETAFPHPRTIITVGFLLLYTALANGESLLSHNSGGMQVVVRRGSVSSLPKPIMTQPIAEIETVKDNSDSVLEKAEPKIVSLFKRLGVSASWHYRGYINIPGIYHTEGMVKIGDNFFISSTETGIAPISNPTGQRTPGTGLAHLTKYNSAGKKEWDVTWGAGISDPVYHPGGIDYDGKYIWIPIAEYRPDSFSKIYRFDPNTRKSVNVFNVTEHIGALVHNVKENTLIGLTWNSDKFDTWKLGKNFQPIESHSQRNPEIATGTFTAYQDCQYIGPTWMLCVGPGPGSSASTDSLTFAKSGIGLFNIKFGKISLVHWLQLPTWVNSRLANDILYKELPLTDNAFTVEVKGNNLQFYFAPTPLIKGNASEKGRIYVFTVVPGSQATHKSVVSNTTTGAMT